MDWIKFNLYRKKLQKNFKFKIKLVFIKIFYQEYLTISKIIQFFKKFEFFI
jgi:hypothetical protein